MKRVGKGLIRMSMLVVAVLGLSLLPGLARATIVLDFNMDATHPAGVSVFYAGGVTPLFGVNISVDSITGLGTPVNPGVMLPIVDGLLTFTTGNFTGFDPSHWNFGPGGSITLTGGIDLNGGGIGPGDIPLGSTLLTGTITDALVAFLGGSFKVALASFLDTKDADLQKYYGVYFDQWQGNLNLSFTAIGSPPGAFASTAVLSGDVTNNPVTPEPATMLLLGSGLVGIGAFARRKLTRKA